MTTNNPDNPEQAPHVDEPVETLAAAAPAASGALSRTNVPGNEGFYTSGSGGGPAPYNNADEAIYMPSDDPGHYLPRAIIDEKWLRRQVAMRSRVARMYTGFEDPLFSYWFYLAGTVAIGGRARRDFVVISTGDRQVEIANKTGGLFSGIGQRLLGNENNNLSK